MFDGLFTYNQKAQLIPDVATKVPTIKNGGIKDGGKTFIVNLKPGTKWANGATLTSADIKFGWKVGSDKVSGPACLGACDVISRIDTPSKYQVVFHLKQITAPFLAQDLPPIYPTKWAGSWINDPHAAASTIYQDTKFNFEGPDFPTNGPYQVAPGGFVNNDRVVLQPMKYYNILSCGGSLKSLIFVFYSSKPGLIAAAASKQTDLTGFGGGYTPADLPELKKHTSDYKLSSVPGFGLEHLEFNLDSTYKGSPNPVSNANVRLALALALNKVGLVQSALGTSAAQARGISAWTYMVNAPTLKQPFADTKITGQWDPITKKFTSATGSGKALADAKALLSKTQWKNGFSIDFITTTGNPVRQAQEAFIAQQWNRIGVKVNVQYVPNPPIFADWAHNGTLDHGDFQVAMFGFTGLPDPDQGKYNLVSTYIDRRATNHVVSNENYAGVANKVIDRAFKAGAHTLVKSGRARAYATIQLEVNKLAYWIPLYYRPVIATADSNLKNFKNNPTQLGPTWNMFQWAKAS
jgi:peptide/nickel transport system substrate-binding protein